jgi:hypothetical protein
MKRYKITITEIGVETQICGKNWAQGADPEKEDGWGYTPEIEKQVNVERKVFEQDTDDLNLVDVIKAVNGL